MARIALRGYSLGSILVIATVPLAFQTNLLFTLEADLHGGPEDSVDTLLYGRPTVLVSISPTFYEQLLRQNPFAKKLQTQIVST